MLNKKILYISCLMAGWLLSAGSLPAGAVVYGDLGQPAPGLPFTPEGNAIGAGKLKFFPELAVGLAYDDNIFYEESGEESDQVSHLIPRLMIDYSLEERGSVKFGYAGDFAYYRDFSDNDWRRHNLGLLLDYNAPSGLFLDIVNDYVDTSDPFGSKEDYALGEQKDRWNNLFAVGLGFNFGDKFRVAAYYNNNKQEYDNEDVDWNQNFDEDEYGVGVEKRISSKTWGFARFLHGSRDYNTDSPDGTVTESNDADYSTDRLFLGLTWDASSRITGELNLGYQWLEYDNRLDAADIPYQDDNTWLAATRIDYSIKPGVTDLHVRFARGTYQRGSFTRVFYDGTYLDVWLLHRFFSWYRLKLNFSIGRNEYNTNRQDDDKRFGIGLEYLVWRRITLGLGYDYTDRDSNIPGESFTINRVLGTITVKY
ncbi:MAG: outer membrane beta-barrel protein [Desulfobulbales bacterium]|nr:outer membrane beta-barrel protein [Desulfobulbales bacterium]